METRNNNPNDHISFKLITIPPSFSLQPTVACHLVPFAHILLLHVSESEEVLRVRTIKLELYQISHQRRTSRAQEAHQRYENGGKQSIKSPVDVEGTLVRVRQFKH